MYIKNVAKINFQAGDVILTHYPFGLFSVIINFTDFLLYVFKKIIACSALICFNIEIQVKPFLSIDHIARVGKVYNLPNGAWFFDLYETVAINKQCKFFSFNRWRGGTIKTRISSLQDLRKHYHHKKIYIKQLKFPLNKEEQNKMVLDLEEQVKQAQIGLNKYSWKYVFLSPFDIFFSLKKRPNKNTIQHINYCQMLIKKNNIVIGLEEDFNQHSEILESPYQELLKIFYTTEIFHLLS